MRYAMQGNKTAYNKVIHLPQKRPCAADWVYYTYLDLWFMKIVVCFPCCTFRMWSLAVRRGIKRATLKVIIRKQYLANGTCSLNFALSRKIEGNSTILSFIYHGPSFGYAWMSRNSKCILSFSLLKDCKIRYRYDFLWRRITMHNPLYMLSHPNVFLL